MSSPAGTGASSGGGLFGATGPALGSTEAWPALESGTEVSGAALALFFAGWSEGNLLEQPLGLGWL